jgi:hypothetical protein
MFYTIQTQENFPTKPTNIYGQFFKIIAAFKTEYEDIPI